MKSNSLHRIKTVVLMTIVGCSFAAPVFAQTETDYGLKSNRRMLSYHVNDSVIVSFNLKTYFKGLDREEKRVFLRDSLYASQNDTIVLSWLYDKQLIRMLRRNRAELYLHEVNAGSQMNYSLKQRESLFCEKSVSVLDVQTQKLLFGYCFGRKESRD